MTAPKIPCRPVWIDAVTVLPPGGTSLAFRTLPATIREVLGALSGQIQVQVFDPLLCAPSRTELARSVETLYPVFAGDHLAMALVVLSVLGSDPLRVSRLTSLGFEEAERLVRDSGSARMGEDVTATMLVGLRTIKRTSLATVPWLRSRGPDRLEEPVTGEWATQVIAYMMVASAVLFSLASGPADNRRGRLENLVDLVRWSRGYAVSAYHLARQIGALSAAPAPGPIPEAPEHARHLRGPDRAASDEEDWLLAESGLDDYRRILASDDLT